MRWQYQSLALVAAGLVAVGLLLFVLSEFRREIRQPWLSTLDQRAMSAVHACTAPSLTRAMLICTFIGGWKFVTPTVIVLILLLLLRRARRDAAILALAVGGSAALNLGLKFFFHRARPSVPWALTHELSFSFPSGHAVAASCFYATIAYLAVRGRQATTRTALITIAVLIALGIGLSRVYLGVHYPSDIAAGYLAGVLWVSTVILAFRHFDTAISGGNPTEYDLPMGMPSKKRAKILGR
jgi:undecaprenyl-diphosphatase